MATYDCSWIGRRLWLGRVHHRNRHPRAPRLLPRHSRAGPLTVLKRQCNGVVPDGKKDSARVDIIIPPLQVFFIWGINGILKDV